MTEPEFIAKWSARFPKRQVEDLGLWTWMLFYDVAQQDYEYVCSWPTAQEVELAMDYLSLKPLDGDSTYHHCRYIQNRMREIYGDLP